jgi:hypothetical protein
MSEWTPLPAVGPSCKGRYVRTAVTVANIENFSARPGTSDRITLPRGAIGFCYAASGVLHVGFMKGFGAEQRDPTRYDYNVTFTFRDIPKLEIRGR